MFAVSDDALAFLQQLIEREFSNWLSKIKQHT